LKFGAYPFEGPFQPIFMVLIMCDFQSLATTVPVAARVFFVSANLDHPVPFGHHFEATVLAATRTACLLPR
jgi:hypothetical protein